MKGAAFLVVAVSFALGGLCFLASDHLYLATATASVFLIEGFLMLLPMVKRFAVRERKRHECYQFVYPFVTTLSASSSLDRAYEAAEEGFSEPLKRLTEGLSSLGTKQKVDYLASYFAMPIYRVFLSLLDLYLERGGDVLSVSGVLLEELTRIEETGTLMLKDARRNLVSFTAMWLMSLGIMSFVRFGLSSFFVSLSSSALYLVAIVGYFLFLAISLYVYARSYTGEKAFLLKRRKKA